MSPWTASFSPKIPRSWTRSRRSPQELSPQFNLGSGPYEENETMTKSDKTVLVTGATGRQGGAVLRHMLPKGCKLRALTFRADATTVQRLASQGIEVVKGDMEDPSSLERATRGVYGVYSVQDFWSVGAKREVQQGKNMADAARKAGVEHFVY